MPKPSPPPPFTGHLSAALFFPEAANPPPSSCVRAQPILYTAVAIVDEAAAASTSAPTPNRAEAAADAVDGSGSPRRAQQVAGPCRRRAQMATSLLSLKSHLVLGRTAPQGVGSRVEF